MGCCAVATCRNHSRKTKREGRNVMYHNFPKDSKMRKVWLMKCKRKDTVNCKNASVCSDHFPEEEYEDDMRNRLLGLPQKRKLKPSAIPSLQLPFTSKSLDVAGVKDRDKRILRRRIRLQGMNCVNDVSRKKVRIEQLIETASEPESNTDKTLSQSSGTNCVTLEKLLLVENEKLKRTVESLQQQIKSLTDKQKVLNKMFKKQKKLL